MPCVGSYTLRVSHRQHMIAVVKIDLDDLVDAGEVAEILGLARRQAVSTYRSRYPDFPAPALEKNSGKCVLWRRQDIEAWQKARRA